MFRSGEKKTERKARHAAAAPIQRVVLAPSSEPSTPT